MFTGPTIFVKEQNTKIVRSVIRRDRTPVGFVVGKSERISLHRPSAKTKSLLVVLIAHGHIDWGRKPTTTPERLLRSFFEMDWSCFFLSSFHFFLFRVLIFSCFHFFFFFFLSGRHARTMAGQICVDNAAELLRPTDPWRFAVV